MKKGISGHHVMLKKQHRISFENGFIRGIHAGTSIATGTIDICVYFPFQLAYDQNSAWQLTSHYGLVCHSVAPFTNMD